jgi:hypothetical protein
MARQKQVFPRDTLAHLWAHQSQDSARDSSGSMYFTGPTLYSYGSHFVIGHWLEDGRLLWNDGTYGNTTSKHQSIGRQSVPRYKWETAIHVPSLNQDGTRKHGFADNAKRCIDAAMHALEDARKARQRRGFHIRTARKYLTSARELFILTGNKKGAAAVPEIAEDADTAAIDAVLRQAKRAEYLSQAETILARVSNLMSDARIAASGADVGSHQSIGEPWHGMLSPACAVMNGTTAARKLLTEAADYVKRAGDKPKRAIQNALKECDALQSAHAAQALADTDAAALDNARINLPRLIGAIASFKRGTVEYRMRFGIANSAEKVRRAYLAIREENRPADIGAWLTRADAVMSGAALASEYADKVQELAEHRADPVRNSVPSFGELRRVAAHCQIPYWRARLETLAAEIASAREEDAARREERNRAAIEAWKAGDAVRPGADWPTLARIAGDYVQTSRGASVPIAHACRLSRIARRVISNGGRAWEPGTGPRVGHFEVQSIGADGSAVIGCHEFSAAEGLRILALLETCEACAAVVEYADEVTA